MNCQDMLEVLRNSLSPTERRQAIDFLFNNCEPSEIIIDEASKLLIDKDKGIRDVVVNGLSKLTEPWNDIAAAFIVSYFYNPNIEIRNLAAEIIIKLKPKDLNPLIQFFYGINPESVKFAIDVFGQIATPDYIDILLEKLNHIDINVRISVIDAIGNIVEANQNYHFDKDNLIQRLILLYEYEDSARPHIIETIGKIGGNLAENFLFNILQNETDFFLRVAAIDSLANCGSNSKVCDLIMEMIYDVNDELKIIFLKTVYAIAQRISYNIELPTDLRYVAHLAISDNNPDVYSAGLIALGNSFKKADIPFIINIVFRNEPQIQQYILQTLLINSEIEAIEEFVRQFFLKYDLTDTENLDFLSYIIPVSEAAPLNKVQSLIKALIKNIIIQKPVYWTTLIQYCLEISYKYSVSELLKHYEISDTTDRTFLEQIFEKFDINPELMGNE